MPGSGSTAVPDPLVPPSETTPDGEPVEGEEAAVEPSTAPTTTAAPVVVVTPTTTPPPTTTTARDLSQAPPLADDGSGVDLPEIDDLPDPVDSDR